MSETALNLFWEGTQYAYHSFARVNRAMSLALIRSGLMNVTLVPYEVNEFPPDTFSQWAELQRHDLRRKGPRALRPQGPSAWIRHVFVPRPNRPPAGMKWIVVHPWEYSLLPTQYVADLRLADEVWTPSTFSRTVLLDSGLTNVCVIPNGVDEEEFSPRGPRAALAGGKSFRFLFVGGTIFRKGIDVLLESYCRAFGAGDDVSLVIKDAGGSIYEQQKSRALVESWQTQPGAPQILYFDDQIGDAELAALYRACDVFVAPYRGEGFSLPTLEAMACGLPVIVTAGGATDDFSDESTGWRIRASPRQLGDHLFGLPLAAPAFVAEPDADHLAELLHLAFRDQAAVRAKGLTAAARAREGWTWTHAARRAITRLDELCGTAMSRELDERLPLP
jgi:glycosyltransferase involved in cell wall biosynthesis